MVYVNIGGENDLVGNVYSWKVDVLVSVVYILAVCTACYFMTDIQVF